MTGALSNLSHAQCPTASVIRTHRCRLGQGIHRLMHTKSAIERAFATVDTRYVRLRIPRGLQRKHSFVGHIRPGNARINTSNIEDARLIAKYACQRSV